MMEEQLYFTRLVILALPLLVGLLLLTGLVVLIVLLARRGRRPLRMRRRHRGGRTSSVQSAAPAIILAENPVNIADELQKLEELHRSGGLSDEEFARAKAAVLGGDTHPPPAGHVPPPVQPVPPPARSQEEETRQWSMFVHLAQLAGFVMPLAGLALPIVLWQIKRQELPGVDVHGKIVVNWIISEIIYLVACFVLSFLVVGIPLLIAVIVCGIVFPIVGGVKASNGEVWEYPLSIRFVN